MKGKKGVELTLNTIIIAVIVLVALAVILFVFQGIFFRSSCQFNEQSFRLGHDQDDDGVKDSIDACACDSSVPQNCNGPIESQADGCPGTNTACKTSYNECDLMIRQAYRSSCA